MRCEEVQVRLRVPWPRRGLADIDWHRPDVGGDFNRYFRTEVARAMKALRKASRAPTP